jgi:hypothetical protein
MGFGLSSGEAWLRSELAVHRLSTIDRGESGGDDLWAGSGLARRQCGGMTLDSAVCEDSGKIRITLYPVGHDDPDPNSSCAGEGKAVKRRDP